MVTLPYKKREDYNAYMREYMKNKRHKTDALTEAYERLVRDFEEATKKKKNMKRI